ncbi:hypothetical protein ACFRR6_41850 [Streptomyces sp. NPDC056891]|uniref:hypothetical protein n=1 Tax=Streptomyces sp. NPDC056891 TaxID=3345961 RepID=UPI00367F22F2
MAWRYHCGNCEETSGWMSRDSAEEVRALHRETAHHGLSPNHEELQTNAERVDPKLWLYFLGACLALGIADKIGLIEALVSLIPEGSQQK